VETADATVVVADATGNEVLAEEVAAVAGTVPARCRSTTAARLGPIAPASAVATGLTPALRVADATEVVPIFLAALTARWVEAGSLAADTEVVGPSSAAAIAGGAANAMPTPNPSAPTCSHRTTGSGARCVRLGLVLADGSRSATKISYPQDRRRSARPDA
jgi:hypothetical protein